MVLRVPPNPAASRTTPTTTTPRRYGDANLSAMKALSKRMVHTHFREGWQYRVEIEGAPADWDLYCKDVSFTPIELEAAEQRVGAHYLNYLNGIRPVAVSMTLRDNQDGRIVDWFEDWTSKVVAPSGTWSLPADYLRTLRLFRLDYNGGATLYKELRVQPQMCGELTESVEPGGGLLEFPVTVQEFRGFGKRY